MDYISILPEIPIPTEDQIKRFKEHVLDAHSWYKHLPLLKGGKFVLYLEPDLDREYYKRYSFGATEEEYIKAFGHLYYLYRADDEWYSDFDTKIEGGVRIDPVNLLDQDFKRQWGITLYPYCHYEFENAYSVMLEDFDRIKSGEVYHPQSESLKEWFEKYAQQEELYDLMVAEERHWIVDNHDCLISSFKMTEAHKSFVEKNERIAKYVSLMQRVNYIADVLRRIEEIKLGKAIEDIINLRKFLGGE